MTFITFTPNYYGYLVKSQQQSLVIDNLYAFVADGVSTDAVANSSAKTIADEQQLMSQIMYGQRIMPSNTVALCRRINWVSGKRFDKYDSNDPDLVDKDFYCLTSQRRVYKCISNNNADASTVEPSSLDYMPTAYGDGYIWQYMYSLTVSQLSDYSTNDLMPVIEDAGVAAAAVRGTVSDVDVVYGGDYLTNSGSVVQIVSNTVFRISDSASSIDDIYNGSAFYISSGPSESSISQITNYLSNSSGRFITVDTPLPDVSYSSQYDIAPFVKIVGDGTNASARAIVSNNEVLRVDMLDSGQNYTYATSTLVANSAASEQGTLKTIISPIKGHGSSVHNELFANYVMFHIELDLAAVDLPLNDITFSRMGILRGLVSESNTAQTYSSNTFNNTATIEVSPLFGTFSKGDFITKEDGSAPYMNVIYANTTHIVGVYAHSERFLPNDNIVNQDGVTSVLGTVTEPDVKVTYSDIVAVVNTDTTQRDENSREILQIIIKIK